MNNERIHHSHTKIYIFFAAKRDGFPSQLGDSFHTTTHLSCWGEGKGGDSIIMDVTGLRSDWSRLLLQLQGICLQEFSLHPVLLPGKVVSFYSRLPLVKGRLRVS